MKAFIRRHAEGLITFAIGLAVAVFLLVLPTLARGATGPVDVVSLFENVSKAWASGGWIAALGAGVSVAVELWSSSLVQDPLTRYKAPGWLLWDQLTPFAKVLITFAAAAIGAGCVAWAGGGSVGFAIGAAVTTGLSALGAHSTRNAIRESKGVDQKLPRLKTSSIRVPIAPDFQAPMIKPEDVEKSDALDRELDQ